MATISQFALIGDSITAGTKGSSSTAQGGPGTWAELVAEAIADLGAFGPLISSGIRGVWLGNWPLSIPQEWRRIGTTTAVVSTDAFDKSPYGIAWYASGAANGFAYDIPATWRHAISYTLYWVDYTGGGNWQYHQGGGPWKNMGQTPVHDNVMAKFSIVAEPLETPMLCGQSLCAGPDVCAARSTVELRASSDDTTAVGCLPIGIELFFLDPATNSGVIFHNVAIGGQTLHALALATSGDRMAIFDAVKTGTGSPITNTPNTGAIVMHINDVHLINNTTTWSTDHTTVYNRLSSHCRVGFISPYEVNPATDNATDQASYRAQTKTDAASHGISVLDLNDQWTALGFIANAGANAAGFLLSDLVHPSDTGHRDIAPRVTWWIRTTFSTTLALGRTGKWVTTVQSAAAGPDLLGGDYGTYDGTQGTEIDTPAAGVPFVHQGEHQATEADTAQAGALVIRKTGQQSSETDTASQGTTFESLLGLQGTEADTAQVGTPKITHLGVQGSETDTGNAGALVIRRTGIQAQETDLGFQSGTQYIFGVQVTETGVATAGTLFIAISGSQATESNTVQTGAPILAFGGFVSSEVNTGQPGFLLITLQGLQAVEINQANVGTHGFINGSQASETDTAFAGSPVAVIPAVKWSVGRARSKWQVGAIHMEISSLSVETVGVPVSAKVASSYLDLSGQPVKAAVVAQGTPAQPSDFHPAAWDVDTSVTPNVYKPQIQVGPGTTIGTLTVSKAYKFYAEVTLGTEVPVLVAEGLIEVI